MKIVLKFENLDDEDFAFGKWLEEKSPQLFYLIKPSKKSTKLNKDIKVYCETDNDSRYYYYHKNTNDLLPIKDTDEHITFVLKKGSKNAEGLSTGISVIQVVTDGAILLINLIGEKVVYLGSRKLLTRPTNLVGWAARAIVNNEQCFELWEKITAVGDDLEWWQDSVETKE